MAAFYPVELVRLRLMLDCKYQSETEMTSGLILKNDIAEKSRLELFHGVVPWAAHNALTWGSFAMLAT